MLHAIWKKKKKTRRIENKGAKEFETGASCIDKELKIFISFQRIENHSLIWSNASEVKKKKIISPASKAQKFVGAVNQTFYEDEKIKIVLNSKQPQSGEGLEFKKNIIV